MNNNFPLPLLLILILSSVGFVYIILNTLFLHFLFIKNSLLTQLLTQTEKEFIARIFNLVISALFALLISFSIWIGITRENLSQFWHLLGLFYVFTILGLPLVMTFERIRGGDILAGLLIYILSIFLSFLANNQFIFRIYSLIFKLANTWFAWLMLIIVSLFMFRFWQRLIIAMLFRKNKGRFWFLKNRRKMGDGSDF